MNYDNEVRLNGDTHGEFVFSWLREDGKAPIRVQAWRTHVANHWGKDWQDAESVKAEFRRRRSEWIQIAEARAVTDDAGVLVFNVE